MNMMESMKTHSYMNILNYLYLMVPIKFENRLGGLIRSYNSNITINITFPSVNYILEVLHVR